MIHVGFAGSASVELSAWELVCHVVADKDIAGLRLLLVACEYPPHTGIDPEVAERSLAAEYGTAYTTVRRATEVLRERGVILTVHGRGTFVKPRAH